MFKTELNQKSVHIMLLLLRMVAAGFMLTHGIPKLTKLMAGAGIQFADPFGLGATPSFLLAIFAEVICSILVFVGLATRLATIPLIVTMCVAAFIAHANDPFGKKELALLYLLIFLFILIAGPGKYAIDNMFNRKLKRHR